MLIGPEEQRHLEAGPRSGEVPTGVGLVDVVASCNGGADQLLERVRDVLRTVIDHQAPEWPSTTTWRTLLPSWFVEACADEMSPSETEAWLSWWRSLPTEQQAAAMNDMRWSLADWLYWFEPEQRQWFWWDATAERDDQVRVVVELAGWPAPFGALQWLLTAAGATDVTIDEPPAA